jgi:hypothetical protein
MFETSPIDSTPDSSETGEAIITNSAFSSAVGSEAEDVATMMLCHVVASIGLPARIQVRFSGED